MTVRISVVSEGRFISETYQEKKNNNCDSPSEKLKILCCLVFFLFDLVFVSILMTKGILV